MGEEKEKDDFMDEAPTLKCIPDGCKSCAARFKCATSEPWEGDTQPVATPAFLEGFDDDYILEDLGGEG